MKTQVKQAGLCHHKKTKEKKLFSPTVFFFFFVFSLFSPSIFAFETSVYILREKTPDRISKFSKTLASLNQNQKKISILIPQAYVIHEDGSVQKGVQAELFEFATQHAIKLMPLVTNSNFDKTLSQVFLSNPKAQQRAIETLVQLCSRYHFYGMQFDFEMIPIANRNQLTQFFKAAASQFHAHHLIISFAIAPVVTDQPNSVFLKKIRDNWEGAYDLKAIGEFSDFVSLMAYNQHGTGSTPGAAANLDWIRQTLEYTVRFIPPEKISLGLADYSLHWFTGSQSVNQTEKILVQARALDYEGAQMLISQHEIPLHFDKKTAVFYGVFCKNWLNEWLFVENAKTLSQKIHLVKQYHLRGVSLFDLGSEDPKIWRYL